ncbi:hypothetical protein GII32_18440 [Gordonia amarae]|uniref:nSTAND1 domain-containing NTPase n=1 Tax=Gordonia amarae TaxID=36821 RepID=UPI001AF9E412|nr:hypothetical protein [Gordonia amarae]QHN32095.1 hypothetical protein GII32_18440 [Gordonia amarae]
MTAEQLSRSAPRDDVAARPRSPEDIRTREDLGAALTACREAAGLSVRDVAERADALLGTVAGWFAGQHAPTKASREPFDRVLGVCGVAPGDVAAWWAAIDGLSRRGGRRRRSRPESPYLGFATFNAGDSSRYFGRREQMGHLVESVAQVYREWLPERAAMDDDETAAAVPPAFVVLGHSGVGKSSLVRVALGSAVGTPGPLHGWKYAVMVPGIDPVGAFEKALDDLHEQDDRPGPAILVIDQYEEILTLHPYAEGIAQGAQWAELSRGWDMVVVSVVRPDIYAYAHEASSRGVPIRGQMLIAPMTAEQLREVIVGPADAAGVSVDDDLVRMLLDDVAGTGGAPGAGALPLLSHALRATWQESDGRRLTVRDYLATGRIAGAVEKSAEDVYAALTPDEQAAARTLLLAMVNVDEDTVTRRVVPLADLTADGEPRIELVERFAAARLLTVSLDNVQVTHEALLTAWPRLTTWIEEDRERLLLVRRLRWLSEVWDANGRLDDLLPGAARLQMFDELVGDSALDQTSRDYLDAGGAKRRAELDARRRNTRKLRNLTRFALVFGVVAVLAAVVAIVTGISSVIEREHAERASTEALSRQLAAEALRLSSRDPFLAIQLAMVAYRQSPTREARSALIDLGAGSVPAGFAGPGAESGRMATAATTDGTQLLALDTAGHFRMLPLGPHGIAGNPVSGTLTAGSGPNTPHPNRTAGEFGAAAFLPGTRTAVVGGRDSLTLWDLTDPRSPRRGQSLPGVSGMVTAVAVDPAGTFVAASTSQAGIGVWTRDGQDWRRLPAPAGMGPVAGPVAFSPDGRMLATGGNYSRIDLWSVSSGGLTPVARIPAFGPEAQSASEMRFTDDGRSLVAAMRIAGAATYDVSDPRHPRQVRTWPSSSAFVNGFGMTGDGSTIALSGTDNTVRIFDSTNPDAPPRTVQSTAHSVLFAGDHMITTDTSGRLLDWPLTMSATTIGTDTVQQFALSADRRRAFAVDNAPGGGVHRWDITDGRLVRAGPVLAPPADGLTGGVAAGGSGHTVVLAGQTGDLHFADYSDGDHPRYVSSIRAQDAVSISVDYNERSRLAVAVSMDLPTVAIIDASDVRNPRKVADVDVGSGASLVTLSPDGRRAAVALVSGVVKLVDLSDPAHPKVTADAYSFAGMAMAARFSRDGRRLAVGSTEPTVAVIDVADPDRPRVVSTWPTAVLTYAVDFNDDGTRVVAGGGTSEVWVWEIGKAEASTILRSFPDGIYDIRYAADRTLVAVGDGGEIRTWSTGPNAIIERECARPGDAISRTEWELYVHDRSYSPPCGKR